MQLWLKPDRSTRRAARCGSYIAMLARRARSTAGARAGARGRGRALRARAGAACTPDSESAAEPVIRARALARRCSGALDELPRDQRDALLLAYGRGLTAQEIAGATGVPLGTAKSRRAAGASQGPREARARRGRARAADGSRSARCARRTGVTEATLRMWESRYGFPEPAAAAERPPPLHGGRRRHVSRWRATATPACRCRRRSSAPRRRAAEPEASIFAGAAPPPARPGALRAAQAHARRADPRDRGRVRRARRAPVPLRLLPARALLPRRRAALARAGPHGRAGDRVRRLPRAARARRRADRGADRPRATRSAASGRSSATRRGTPPASRPGSRPARSDVPDLDRQLETIWSRRAGGRPRSGAHLAAASPRARRRDLGRADRAPPATTRRRPAARSSGWCRR